MQIAYKTLLRLQVYIFPPHPSKGKSHFSCIIMFKELEMVKNANREMITTK